MKRKNLWFCIGVGCMIVLVVAGLLTGICHRAHRKAIPVQIDPARPAVAITFDDGPNPNHTPQVLDVLYEQQVPATFFLVGEKFDGNELLIKEIAASGHEIGNHTFSHPDLTKLDKRQILKEIVKTEIELQKILPDYTINYVRPPYGRYTEEVEAAVGLPLMLWTIDSGEWENPDAEKIYATVVDNIQDGDIIVFHDDNTQTAAALEQIIVTLKARGFQFVTVSQLESINCDPETP